MGGDSRTIWEVEVGEEVRARRIMYQILGESKENGNRIVIAIGGPLVIFNAGSSLNPSPLFMSMQNFNESAAFNLKHCILRERSERNYHYYTCSANVMVRLYSQQWPPCSNSRTSMTFTPDSVLPLYASNLLTQMTPLEWSSGLQNCLRC